MLGKLIFCANHGVRSLVEKDAAIAADVGSVGHKQYFTMITRFWRDVFVLYLMTQPALILVCIIVAVVIVIGVAKSKK